MDYPEGYISRTYRGRLADSAFAVGFGVAVTEAREDDDHRPECAYFTPNGVPYRTRPKKKK